MGKEITDIEIIHQLIERGVYNTIRCYCPQFSFVSEYVSNALSEFIDPYLEVLTNGGSFNSEVARAYAKKEISGKIDDFIMEFEKERDSEMKQRSHNDQKDNK